MERAVPVLPVDDLCVAKEFYVNALGFQVLYEASEDGKTGILGLERGTIRPIHECTNQRSVNSAMTVADHTYLAEAKGSMATYKRQLADLMDLASGDEKHDPSAYSTLEVLWVLYDRILNYDASRPQSEDRDRFIMSKGHGPLALYAILAQKGFFPASELARFLQWEGILGGHPDRNRVPGVETSTGSLGHGFPMAIGVALALKAKGSDRRVYVLIGDGEANEGSVWEAVLLAGDLSLSNLTAILIDNRSSTRDLGDLATKFKTFGWDAQVVDGRDEDAIENALSSPATDRPSVVVAEVLNHA
jgi:transketolase